MTRIAANLAGERWTVERIEHAVVPLLLAVDAQDALVCVSLGAKEAVVEAHARKHGATLAKWGKARSSEAARQLGEFLAGSRTEFELKTRPMGTEFQRAAWLALTKIPHGETRTYAEQAVLLGNPRAVRAVGGANGANPIPIVIPCHRVIGSNGSLTGFGGGLPAKRWLLDHEAPLFRPSLERSAQAQATV